MALTEHPGPKGQLFLRGQDKPLWFASVRDTFAFTMLPEMPKNIAAIYVNDMGRVRNWASRIRDVVKGPQRGVRHRSRQRTGMGTDEAVPFGDRQRATVRGGKWRPCRQLQDMPHDYVFPEGDGS